MTRLVFGILIFFATQCVSAIDKVQKPDNGTDPTRLSTTAEARYEHIDLVDGYTSDTLNLSYIQPFGARQNYSLRLRVPVVSVDVAGNDDYKLGDVQLRLSNVAKVTHSYGIARCMHRSITAGFWLCPQRIIGTVTDRTTDHTKGCATDSG